MSFFRALDQEDGPKNTRQRILEAAIKMFATKGYHDTRVDEIVADSKTSKGAVYFHFPGKQEVFLTLIDELASLLEAELAQAISQETDGVRRVNAALEVCLATFSRYRKLAKIFLVQAVGLGAAFEEKRLEIHDRFIRTIKRNIEQAIEEGDIESLNSDIVATAWMGAIYEVLIRWVQSGEPEPEVLISALRGMLLRSIGVSEERIQTLEQLAMPSSK